MNLEEKYKEYTNKRLIEVIVKADDYQPQAVELAEKILNTRDISIEEKNELIKAVESEKISAEKLEKKQLEVEKKRIQALKNIFNKINPFDKTEPISFKLVNIILIVFGYVFLEQFYYSFTFLIILLDPPISFDIVFFTTLFEVFFLPLTIYLYFKRKKVGWMMLVAWICTFTVSYTILIAVNLSMPEIPETEDAFLDFFELLIYKPNYSRLFLILAFYLVGLIVLLRKGVRQVFSVSKLNMFLAIVIGVIVSVSMHLAIPYLV